MGGRGCSDRHWRNKKLEISFYSSKTFLTLHWVSLRVAAKRDTFCLELSERSLLVIPSWSREVNGFPSQSRCAPKVRKYARKPPLPRLCKRYWRGFGFCLLSKRQTGTSEQAGSPYDIVGNTGRQYENEWVMSCSLTSSQAAGAASMFRNYCPHWDLICMPCFLPLVTNPIVRQL